MVNAGSSGKWPFSARRVDWRGIIRHPIERQRITPEPAIGPAASDRIRWADPLYALSPSWPGLVPATHVFLSRNKDVDARHKAGHDSPTR